MIFLDPKSDIAFKKLFSNAQHTEIVINFLNNTLNRPKGKKIVSVTINDPYNHPETITAKSSIVDVRCTDQNGSEYILEMQVVNQQDYAERSHYYYDRNLDELRIRNSQIATARDEGKLEGEKAQALTIAKNLLDVLDTKTIALKTGLSVEEIESLKKP
jgi:hypothetical protein